MKTMSEEVLIEVCVDSVASAVAAQRGGADCIELCSDLLEGGVTASAGLLATVRSRISIGLHTIIRPRPGDFCYTDEEFEVMLRDIEIAKEAGADGVVVGVLEAAGTVDIRRTRMLVEAARPLAVTFHRAFDMCLDQLASLEDVCTTGVDRLLTSGGEQQCQQGIATIAQLVRRSQGRIAIMAGGGIRHHNVAEIIGRTGVREIHVGLGTPVASPALSGKPRISVGKARGQEYERTEVLEENVRELKQAISLAALR